MLLWEVSSCKGHLDPILKLRVSLDSARTSDPTNPAQNTEPKSRRPVLTLPLSWS